MARKEKSKMKTRLWFAFCAGVGLFGALPLNATLADELPALNDPATSAHLEGKFIWADLFTTDAVEAAHFYAGMFDWTPTTLSRDGRSYILLKHDGRAVAGIVQRPANRSSGGPAARWVNYIAVSDLTRTLSVVVKSRGKVIAPAREFPRRGTQAIVADNEDAVIGLLHSSSGDTEDYQPEVGEWIWAELLTSQPEVAASFYRNVFGYEVTEISARKGNEHFVLAAGGFARASIGALPLKDDARPAWLGYVRVLSADKAADRATALGGRVLVTPRLSQHGTLFAVVADPTGAAIAVIEFKPSKGSVPSP